MKKIITRSIIGIVFIIFLFVIIYSIWLWNYAKTIDMEFSKDYNSIYVTDEIENDYRIFLDIPSEYSALEQLDLNMRYEIALYMKENKLKLKVGEQRFNRLDGTFDELVNKDFGFEKIQ